MGILDKFKKKRSKNIEIEILARKNSDTAVDYAKSFRKKFDYSPNSIKDWFMEQRIISFHFMRLS